MQVDEKDIQAMNMGRKAGMVLESLGPLCDEQEQSIVNNMKNMYRDGSFSESKLVAMAAQLVALDDLKNRLGSKIRKADKISREIHGNERH